MKLKLGLFVAICMVLLTPAALLAEKGATGVVKERMDLMETQKDAMKVIGAMAKGEAPFDSAKAGAAATEIKSTAAEIVDLFPEGTVGPPSEAKPEIWTQWDKFTADAEALETAATALETALADGVSGVEGEIQGRHRFLQGLSQNMSSRKEEVEHTL